MARMGKIHVGRPLKIKSRKELLQTVRPTQVRYLRQDTGDVPAVPPMPEGPRMLTVLPQNAAAAPL